MGYPWSINLVRAAACVETSSKDFPPSRPSALQELGVSYYAAALLSRREIQSLELTAVDQMESTYV
jgi:hypothetical protein